MITTSRPTFTFLLCSAKEAPDILELLFRAGFDLLAERAVPAEDLEPIPVPFSVPTLAVLLTDVAPMVPGAWERAMGYDNARLCTFNHIKAWLCNAGDDGRRSGSSDQFHMWWTRNCSEALKVARSIWGSAVKHEAREAAGELARHIEPPSNGVYTFDTYKTRASVHRVREGGKNVIMKTFKKGRERYLQNEVEVHGLASEIPGLPRMIDVGPNWIMVEEIQQAQSMREYRNRFSGLKMSVTRRIADFIAQLHEARYAPLDFSPQNVLMDPQGDLWFIDFELAHRYSGQETSLENNYVYTGYPFGLSVDGLYQGHAGYDAAWYPITGIRREMLLSGSELQQRKERAIYLFGSGARGARYSARKLRV